MTAGALVCGWDGCGTSTGVPRTAVISELGPVPVLRLAADGGL